MNKKRNKSKFTFTVLLLFIGFILNSGIFPVTEAFAARVNPTDFEYVITDGEAEITGMKPSILETVIRIPSEVEGVPVTRIGKEAFARTQKITDFILPDTVLYIGESAFTDCYDMKSIVLPAKLKEIGEKAFFMCRNVREIIMPETVTHIGNNAFEHCGMIKKVVLPSGLTRLGDNVFHYCSALEEINIPPRLQYIGNNTFNGCRKIKGFDLPATVTSIGDSAFAGCNFKSFSIPDSVKTIGVMCFQSCSYLESVRLSASLEKISEKMFDGCRNLVDITIPDSVKVIEKCAFQTCESLTKLPIGPNVTAIGKAAYYGCKKLNSISLPVSVTSIGEDAFYGTGYYENTLNWGNGGLYIGTALIEYPYRFDGTGIKEGTVLIADGAVSDCDYVYRTINLPSSVKYIGERAFSGRITTVYISIPASVEKIGFKAFSFSNISHYEVDPANKYYSSDSTGALFDKNKTELIEFPNKNKATSYKVPSTVKVIGTDAFSVCQNLESVTLPQGLKRIESSAFDGASSIKNITIPDTVEYIGGGAFYMCTSLTEIVFPLSVKMMGTNVVSGCRNLRKIVFMNPNLELEYIGRDFSAEVRIHGYSNSTAREYAEKYELPFVSIGVAPVIRVKETDSIRIWGDDFIMTLPGTALSELTANLGAAVVIEDKDGNAVSPDSQMKSGIRIILKYQSGTVADIRTVIALGDNDGDGVISSSDARLALRKSVGLENFADWQMAASDVVDRSAGDVTSSDARAILRASVGLDDAKDWFNDN